MKNSNKIVVDLKKVTHAQMKWCCHSLGRTYKRDNNPIKPTVNGHEFDCDSIRNSLGFCNDSHVRSGDETMLEYATRRNLLDTWYPELELQLSNNHSLIYTGDKLSHFGKLIRR